VRIGIDRPFLLDAAARRLHELKVERPGEPTDDLVLGFREVAAIGLEPLRPQVSSGFRVDRLPQLCVRIGGALSE
jgi:hypothetical protein